MYSAVAAAWPPMCRRFEGVTTWMYLDTKGKVTTGVGFLIDSIAAAQALPWLTRHAAPAAPEQVADEWRRVKARTDWTRYSGLAAVWRDSATLHLTDSTVTRLLATKTGEFWTRLGRTLPDLDTSPADAQLALLDLAWQNGPAFLDPGTAWVGTRAAVLAQDWAAAASHVPGTGARADARKRLFSNAAAVVTLKLDPAILWDTRIPTAPKEPDVAVNFRGGLTCQCVATSLPVVEKEMLRRGLIKYNIDIFQLGYRSDVSASAGTHAGGGNTDVGQYSDAQIQCWRDLGWTMQRRTRSQGFDQDHGHGWPWGCTHLSSGARAQADQWRNRQNGLRSRGPVQGKWPVDTWQDAMRKQLAAQRAREEAAADAARQKELALPTTAEVAKALASDKDFLAAVANAVINADVIPNTFTSNAENLTVSTKTALTTLGKRSGEINAKLDALIARFPEQPPAPPA